MEGANFSALPEGCISHILSLTSPRDACSSSLVSTTFKSAADSDVVWEKFLPSDYKEIVSRSSSPFNLSGFSSKKELYLRLSDDPILIDGGNKSFNLEKRSGKKCFMIGAKDLRIDWSDTPHYWEWISLPGSRFAEIAELHGVWWLYVCGTIETRMLSPQTTYAAYLVIKFSEHAFALAEPPTDVVVEFVGGGGSASGARTVYLEDPKDIQRLEDPEDPEDIQRLEDPEDIQQLEDPEDVGRPIPREDQVPRARGDGWMEIEMGDFYNDQGEDGEVQMILKETAGHYKGGLIVEGIELRPK